jgi:DNA-cytosine methyltransferase
MKFVDWFAGVGGFRLALESAGHKCVWSCEIDGKARAVYALRFGKEPEAGDIDLVTPEQIPDSDIWVGGFPCQDVSVAGRREGLAGQRTGLVWKLFELAKIKQPKMILLENVPGLFTTDRKNESSADGRPVDDWAILTSGFGELLRAMAELWPAVGWRVLDARYFGVAQRRRRVFLAGGAGEASVKQVLLEPESGSGNSKKGKKKRPGTPRASNDRTDVVGTLGHLDHQYGTDEVAAGHVITQAQIAGAVSARHGVSKDRGDGQENLIVGQAVNCKWAKGSSGPSGDEHHNLVVAATVGGMRRGAGHEETLIPDHVVAAPITAGGHPNSNAPGRRKEDDENLVIGVSDQVTPKIGMGIMPTLKAGEKSGGRQDMVAYFIDAYATRGSSSPNQNPVKDDGKSDALDTTGPGAVALAGTLQASGAGTSRPAGMASEPDFCVVQESQSGVSEHDVSGVVRAEASQTARMVRSAMMVRRLTPTETERLQGFPDGHTCVCGVKPDCPEKRIPEWIDPKVVAIQGCGHSTCGCKCPDGPRYKQMGNAIAVPVVRWIANRLGV